MFLHEEPFGITSAPSYEVNVLLALKDLVEGMEAWKPEHGIYMDSKYNLVYPEGATHLDGIPEDVLEFIHPHWGKFPPQHPLVVHVVGIAFFFLWLLSFFGNGSVIYVFLKVRKAPF